MKQIVKWVLVILLLGGAITAYGAERARAERLKVRADSLAVAGDSLRVQLTRRAAVDTARQDTLRQLRADAVTLAADRDAARLAFRSERAAVRELRAGVNEDTLPAVLQQLLAGERGLTAAAEAETAACDLERENCESRAALLAAQVESRDTTITALLGWQRSAEDLIADQRRALHPNLFGLLRRDGPKLLVAAGVGYLACTVFQGGGDDGGSSPYGEQWRWQSPALLRVGF